MEYREFGKTGEKLSILGFGAMRLPVIDGDNSKIDYDKATLMVRNAIDNGINYLDTAYVYHGNTSEAFCASILKDGYREKINIATKHPVWEVKTYEDYDKYLDEQMSNLEVDCIDFYLMHALNKDTWKTMKEIDYRPFIEQAKKDGKIKYAGFSFHDELDLFKEIVDDYDWDFCQIQMNYLDEKYQAGLEGLEYAHTKGMGVIIMEPLRGGALADGDRIADDIKALWNTSEVKRTPAQWGLKYLWNKKEVGVVLSGMNTMEQVNENIETASNTKVNSLTDKENELIAKVADIYKDRTMVNCTRCNYCMPCPQGVDIPGNFRNYNHSSMFMDMAGAKRLFQWLSKEELASNCVQCGLCETKCPQNIEIIRHLADITEKFEL